MDMLIWGGAALTMAGVLTLLWCIILAMRARKSALPEDQIKAQLQRVVVLNLGALAVSGLGLIVVVTGIFLS
ncbi:hypothetical protein [Pseudotabrizicola alkalilacus]|uniref:Uncharacterized protein n=1 Tax=Pseudotabrizicola alkalilacus TaxID=2305252 RepID=A0A411Z1E4_9RHOB|nr:hypothetical protein [Pseudotabrizicola alkalilacus]RGP36889.1 hypothetical protein D1012_12100 [Pseudotabrizicola alkalilacus]